ncbi:uncharacterized protein LOC134253223 [Saccostrea cucullata]|uniref:uncharacterized protein LOC134253223 n=1 Tax=Saccostrea cuccullata TaxID=36930 RepID=UPI002ED288B2
MRKAVVGYSITVILLMYMDFQKCDGTILKNKSKISWNDIIKPNYNTGKISPWNSNESIQKQHSNQNSAASNGGVVQQMGKKTSKLQNNNKSQQEQDIMVPSKSMKEQNKIHVQLEKPPQDNIFTSFLKTFFPWNFDAYYSDHTTMKPTHEYQYTDHDLYYYYNPDFYLATVNPTPFYDYSTKKKLDISSFNEELEYEGEEMTTVSGATRSSAGGKEIEAEDITTVATVTSTDKPAENETEAEDITTPKSRASAVNNKVASTTEKSATEGVELEDRTTPSSAGKTKQKITAAPRKQLSVFKTNSNGGVKVMLNRPSKRFPPKYRFPKYKQRYQVPVLKEINSGPKFMTRIPKKIGPIYSNVQNQLKANKIKYKIVHKSTRVSPVIKSFVVNHAVPKQRSHIQRLPNRKISVVHKTEGRHNLHLQKPINLGRSESQGCRKRQKCPSNLRPVCGTDGLSYRNECVLKSVACVRGGQNKLRIRHKGIC